ncbi:S1 family peptidase [Streptomyces roseifaciens]
MSAIRPRAAWMTGLLGSAVAASLLTAVPAHAVVGEPGPDWTHTFTTKLDINEGMRSCSASLVQQEWLITAASCFADDPAKDFKIATGAPKWKTTATIGRTDLSREDTGTVVDVVELVPRDDRDLVMARLAKPVTNVDSVTEIMDSAPQSGDSLKVTGYGRTKDEWVPDRRHLAKFKVGSVGATTLRLDPESPDAAICQGDAGGPVFDSLSTFTFLYAINSNSGQSGCFGTDESETRRTASAVRVDDIAGWVKAVASRNVLSGVNWKDAIHVVPGRFTATGKGSSDLFVTWADGSASIFESSGQYDPKRPFLKEHKVAPKGSYWKNAEAVTSTKVTDSGRYDGLTVRWNTGKLSTYGEVNQWSFLDEKTLAYSDSWKNARSLASGRHTGKDKRNDLVVLWADGSTSMYADTDVNGVSKETQLTKADKTWEDARITSGQFTGKGTDDLVIRWKNGKADLFPGLEASGFHGNINLRPEGSAWKYAQPLVAGSFGSGEKTDLLARWSNGNLSYYADVDASGTHKEIQLVG